MKHVIALHKSALKKQFIDFCAKKKRGFSLKVLALKTLVESDEHENYADTVPFKEILGDAVTGSGGGDDGDDDDDDDDRLLFRMAIRCFTMSTANLLSDAPEQANSPFRIKRFTHRTKSRQKDVQERKERHRLHKEEKRRKKREKKEKNKAQQKKLELEGIRACHAKRRRVSNPLAENADEYFFYEDEDEKFEELLREDDIARRENPKKSSKRRSDPSERKSVKAKSNAKQTDGGSDDFVSVYYSENSEVSDREPYDEKDEEFWFHDGPNPKKRARVAKRRSTPSAQPKNEKKSESGSEGVSFSGDQLSKSPIKDGIAEETANMSAKNDTE
jgi:hypothetical protein